MHDIIQNNVRPLRDGRARRDPNAHVLQILVAVRELAEGQGLVLGTLGRVRQADRGDLLAVDVEADDGEGAALGQPFGGARVGAEAVVEARQVEGLDAWPALELGVGVERHLTELEEVDRAGGSRLVLGRMGDHAGGANDGFLG